MKEQYHLVSFSGGKDSTAMLLGMLERDMKIDCILFCDTGLEFPAFSCGSALSVRNTRPLEKSC